MQICIVHLTRASLRWVNYKDRKRVAAQLKLISGAPTEQAARDAWTPAPTPRPAVPGDQTAVGGHLGAGHPVLRVPPEVRKVIYTTNMIESINYQLRKLTKTRGHFPIDDALIKLLYLGCREMGRTTRAGRGAPRTTTVRSP